MASPVFRPAPPVPASWAPAGGWTAFGAASGAADAAAAAAAEEARRYDAYIASIQSMLRDAAGEQRRILQLQLADAEKGRANAYRIAQLQADTSRYGTDVQREVELARLEENQRQFDANHELEMQRFGLDVVKTGVDYLSTPDRAFMFSDFNEGLGRIGLGLNPTPYGTQGQPHMKTWQDFAALSGFGNVPAVQAGQSSAQVAAQQGADQAQQAGDGADPRVKAAMGILKAIPPSDGVGHDADSFAALDAIESVFRASKPGTYERMRPGQQAMFRGGLARLGYVPEDAIAQLRRNNPGQGSVRQA